MKVFTLKDIDGKLRPKSFICNEDELKYYDKEIKRLTNDGSLIVLAEITEII